MSARAAVHKYNGICSYCMSQYRRAYTRFLAERNYVISRYVMFRYGTAMVVVRSVVCLSSVVCDVCAPYSDG